MAKQPAEVTHRFRIHAETTSEALGPLLAQLTIMGLERVGYELITDVTTYNKRTPHAIPMTQALLQYMEEHPTFAIYDVVQAFAGDGRTKGAVYTAARTLVAAKKLRRLDAGNYQAMHVKAIAGPKAKADPALQKLPKLRTRAPTSPKNEIPNRRLIEVAIRGRKRFTVEQMRKLLADEGRSPKSASPIISVMQKNKLIRLIAPGEYEVLPKKPEKVKVKKVKLTPRVKLNGAAAASEAAANG